jgi:hypothetical protein
MQVTIGKFLSLLVATGYIVIAFTTLGIHGLEYCIGLSVPLAFIWFPDEIGELTGYFRTGYVNVQTPGPIISFLGWLFLVGLPVLLYFITRHYA